MTRYSFTDEGEQWALRPVNFIVTQLCFDYRVTLNIVGDSDYYFSVAIGNRFSFMDAGKIHVVDVEADPVSASTLLALRMRPVLEVAIAHQEGVLHIRFAGDAAIVVEANSQYEAWELNEVGPVQGLRIVCMPGGQLAVWDAQ